MTTQLIGFNLATPTAWRYVLLFSGLTATAQFLVSSTMVESPVWAVRNGDPQSGKIYHQKLWKGADSHCECNTSLNLPGLTRTVQHQMRTHCSLETLMRSGNRPSASHTLSRRVSCDCPSQSCLSLWFPNKCQVLCMASSPKSIRLILLFRGAGVNAGTRDYLLFELTRMANFGQFYTTAMISFPM